VKLTRTHDSTRTITPDYIHYIGAISGGVFFFGQTSTEPVKQCRIVTPTTTWTSCWWWGECWVGPVGVCWTVVIYAYLWSSLKSVRPRIGIAILVITIFHTIPLGCYSFVFSFSLISSVPMFFFVQRILFFQFVNLDRLPEPQQIDSPQRNHWSTRDEVSA